MHVGPHSREDEQVDEPDADGAPDGNVRDDVPAACLEGRLQTDGHHNVGVENVAKAEATAIALSICPESFVS